MRHRVYGSHLGRNKDERNRLFKSLLQALFTHGAIETSSDKAKAIKGLVDKVINLAKNKDPQRLLQSYFNNKDLQERLIKEIVPKLGDRTSGYTSVVKLGTRLGDRTMMVRMSLIGVEKLEPIKKGEREKGKGESQKKDQDESFAKALESSKKELGEVKAEKRTESRKGEVKTQKSKVKNTSKK